MILSKELLFSESQALTADAVSTNVIDLGATGTVKGAPVALKRDIGTGTPIDIVVQLEVAAGGTSPTLIVTVEVDDNSSFSSAKVVATSTQLAGGAVGDRIDINYLPQGTDERYMRLNYNLGGTSPTYTVSSFVPAAAQTNKTVAGV